MIQLSLFRGVHDTQPRPVTLEELVTMMRTDQSVRDLTEKHRYARATGDEQGASRYKKMMTSFGVAARFEGGRRQKHIVEFTGLSLADFDHIPEERMAEVLALVHEDEHTLVAYTTMSGKGVRVLFRYEAPSTPPEGELTGIAGLAPLRSVAALSPLPVGSSVAQGTALPLLGTACHLGNPLKASLRPLKVGTVPSDSFIAENTLR